MKNYSIKNLRNVCLLGHGSSGKTTLAEAMLFNSGAIDRMGKIANGNTTMDFDPEEIKRNFSINTSIAPVEWKDVKINFIDTPGYFDFVGEVVQGLRAAESAVILVPAKNGVEVGTEKAMQYVNDLGISKMFFISKMDEENANFDKTYQQLKDAFGTGVVAFQFPIIDNGKFAGIVDILANKAYTFDKGKAVETKVPSDLEDSIEEIREGIMEAIAETDESLMEKYFEGEPFTQEEINKGLSAGITDGSIYPVLCGSSEKNMGIDLFANAIVDLFPAPDVKKTIQAKTLDGEVIELEVSENEKLSALIFKTIADPFVGKISMFKVYSGSISADTQLFNSNSERNEKIAQLFFPMGKQQVNTNKIIAGDIGALAKLQANTNDTLCTVAKKVVLDKIKFPEPTLSLAVEPMAKGDEDKIGSGLQRLLDEDPTFRIEINPETRQTLIKGMGDQHLDVITSKLKAKFGVDVRLVDPKVPYRETIKKTAERVEGKHKKQSGGHGQYGHVFISFEPCDSEEMIFEEKVFGGSVPKNFFPAVEKGLRESVVKGVLAGFPMVNLKATLLAVSYHPVDSSEMAFKIAASLAYKKGIALAGPILLEPIYKAEITIPDANLGDIIGDMNKRRGRILGMEPLHGGLQKVTAEVPLSEIFKYATDLRSMTQARGTFTTEFIRYEEVPASISEKVIADAAKAKEEE
ncbi:MAG TPA: elongation factor G [Clostridiales bacterium]|nr:elongation factor G [Clostridiales bacterium]